MGVDRAAQAAYDTAGSQLWEPEGGLMERRARSVLCVRVLTVVLVVGAFTASGAVLEPAAVAAAEPSGLQLPFPVGETWWSNGPHADSGTVRNSVDFGVNATRNVVAAGAGVVSSVSNCGGGGVQVTIDHTGALSGWKTRYWHLSSNAVNPGAHVSAGQVIGKTGLGCGANGFNHVHFSVWRNGQPLDLNGLNIGGHTLHSKSYNYGGYWTRNSDGAKVAEDSNGNSRCCLKSLAGTKPVWAADFVDQAAFLDAGLSKPWDLGAAYPSQEGWLKFRVRNTGTKTWSRTGANPVRLGTANPQDRSSALHLAGGWLAANRPAAMSQPTVAPGQVATLVFKVRVPEGSGALREHFKLVAEGATWFGPTMWRDFGRPAWSATFVDQHAYGNSALTQPWNIGHTYPGEEGYLRFRVRNTGAKTWSRNGSNPVKLGTTVPDNRASPFNISGSWLSKGRPAAMKESSVPPGKVATFLFKVRVPNRSGTVREHYKVVAEGAAWMGPVMWRDFTIHAMPAVWGVNSSDQVFRRNGSGWTRVPGSLRQVDVGRTQVWGVNRAGAVYQHAGANRWAHKPGRLRHVSVGTAANGAESVWGINAAGYVYRWAGSRWAQMPGRLTQLDVGDKGQVWGVNSSGYVYRWTGSGWERKPGVLKHISAGTKSDGSTLVWGVNRSGYVYRWEGSRWGRIQGRLDQIDVGRTWVWGVNPADRIYHYAGSGRWNLHAGRLSHVSVGH